jgi:tRNA-specific 2-thiouridylase
MARILAALSGGVDSSAAAALLVEDGHDVVGAYMKNWINEENIVGNCPWEEDITDARAVADALGIEFRIVNLMQDYRDRVVKYLLEGYQRGITPNPDVMCNREMKFGVFRDYAIEEGFEKVATGHYAQLQTQADGSSSILRGLDGNKDQTYFLALLRQEQAASALFPIGHLPKPEVRALAEKFALPNARKKDSQGICFIGEVKMTDFLDAFVPKKPGQIVNTAGKPVGEHDGLHLYTLGQRRGIGVASPIFKKAYVVVEKREATNELVVGFDEPETPRLYATSCVVTDISFLNNPFAAGDDGLLAQPRYRTPSVPFRLESFDPATGQAEIRFEEPQRALTPGQICAFYRENELLGGGIFQTIQHDQTELSK